MKDLKTKSTYPISEVIYPDRATRQYLARQAQLYEEKRKELLNQYVGQYIIFEDGEVLDADGDEAALIRRAYAKTGPKHLFVKKVLAEEPEFTARLPLIS